MTKILIKNIRFDLSYSKNFHTQQKFEKFPHTTKMIEIEYFQIQNRV